jgi:tetratricopeptide (TPR) repeat protein
MSELDPSTNEAAYRQAMELGDEGERLALAGNYREAVPILNEAVRLHRSLTGPHPSVVVVAATLNNLGFCLGRLQQHGHAVGALQEAKLLCEPLWKAAQHVEVLRLMMARILGALGYSLAMLGEFEAAVPVTEDLIWLQRSLLPPGPAQIDFDLGKDLRLFALVRARVGVDGEKANAAIGEALLIFQILAQQDAARFMRELITTYDVLAEVLDLLGKRDDAALVRSHLVTEYESLATAMEKAGRHEEAKAIRTYSAALAAKP